MDEAQTDYERAAEEMRELEQSGEVPTDLSEWPTGKAKYVTFGEDSDEPYGEGPTEKLGPAEVERHADGRVTIAGEEVDPEDHKGEPISSGMIEQVEESKRRYREILEQHPEWQKDGEQDA